ncbi:hypothetical protein DOJK_00626 [Patescibacteria group bacterium]|nr:hypothetical protein DOJK_00626 [Patescibacteria group bacterium]
MDVTQALKDTENLLRDFIAVVLQKAFGDNWLDKCGVSEERIKKWEERKTSEENRQLSGVVEERLIYYADFYDLKTILKKHWSGEFSKALGDWKTMEVLFTELEKLRDPDAHRRELLPHQKHLILGISGEIRTRLIRYRSKQETSEDYYPRIESARDSLGNIYTFGQMAFINTKMCLRIGDVVEFVVTASDPLGANLQYSLKIDCDFKYIWQDSNVITLTIKNNHVGRDFKVLLLVRSPREYHANGFCDDSVCFAYEVLPPRV